VLGFVGTDEIGLSGVEQSYNEKFAAKAARFIWSVDRDRNAAF
jgi:cell division protein FtsI/penicillin-binding protein 2